MTEKEVSTFLQMKQRQHHQLTLEKGRLVSDRDPHNQKHERKLSGKIAFNLMVYLASCCTVIQTMISKDSGDFMQYAIESQCTVCKIKHE